MSMMAPASARSRCIVDEYDGPQLVLVVDVVDEYDGPS